MLVEVDSKACPARLSLMPKATYLIEHPIPCSSMPEVIGMVAYSTFLSHLPNKSMSSSGHSHDGHVIKFESLT